jgi:hypothetical protein
VIQGLQFVELSRDAVQLALLLLTDMTVLVLANNNQQQQPIASKPIIYSEQ